LADNSAIRRVVTGHDEDGRAIFVSDQLVDPVRPSGRAYYQLWGADLIPRLPDDGSAPAPTTFFPPKGGFRFTLFEVPPNGRSEGTSQANRLAASAELEALVPGIVQYLEPEGDGMHTTPTIDCEIILSGNIVLELDDRASVLLSAGDTVVQNGTRHRWINPGAEPAVLALFSVGADHAKFDRGRGMDL
jgi:mannose-6-phosphate isomerase-like protein (cupin superfamily)